VFAAADPYTVLLIGVAAAIVAPLGALALSRMNASQAAKILLAAAAARKTERQEDYDWQKKLADDQAKVTNDKLDKVAKVGVVTHALLNSDKTASLERERVLIVAQRASLQANMVLMRTVQKQSGIPEDEESRVAMTSIKTQVTILDDRERVLEAEIADRLAQQHVAEAQVEQGIRP
jgi:hypothetical protein